MLREMVGVVVGALVGGIAWGCILVVNAGLSGEVIYAWFLGFLLFVPLGGLVGGSGSWMRREARLTGRKPPPGGVTLPPRD